MNYGFNEFEFNKIILTLGKQCEFIASTSMNESCHKMGSKFRGTAIVWDSFIIGTINNIVFDNN